MIIGQEKPSLEEALEHFGTKGMKWGVRKQNRTSLANIGDRLNKKSAPKTRSLVRNGAGFLGGQAAVMGLTVAAIAGAAAVTMPATVAVGFMATPAMLAAAGAGSVGSLIQAGMSAGVTGRDLAAISASKRRNAPAKKSPAKKK